jgi:CspA family cold shock protein
MKGKVRWYSHQGYGFIDAVPITDGEAIYFHITAVKNRTIFKAGDAVSFDTAPSLKGTKAVNVRAADTKEETCHQKT